MYIDVEKSRNVLCMLYMCLYFIFSFKRIQIEKRFYDSVPDAFIYEYFVVFDCSLIQNEIKIKEMRKKETNHFNFRFGVCVCVCVCSVLLLSKNIYFISGEQRRVMKAFFRTKFHISFSSTE